MKKISKSNWERYKKAEGRETIALFERLYSKESTMEEIIDVAKRFDSEYFKNLSDKDMDYFIGRLCDYGKFYGDILVDMKGHKFETFQDYIDFFIDTFTLLSTDNPDETIDDIPQSTFKGRLSDMMMISIALNSYLPEFFIPNFFVMQFMYLKKIVEKYEIEGIPEIPNRSDYRERCLYYLDICVALVAFGMDNGFESNAELCAFLYDYEMINIKEEMEDEFKKTAPKVPEQAWILVGNYGEGEKNMESGFWQANEQTHKGDIMLFYEKSPVKKLNSVWIALADGVKDPFFHYYSHTYIGRKIEIPADKAISFEEFKNNDYFKKENRGSEGNFVSKNFQDVSGWAVTYADYAEIKRMLKAKGFDTSVLPSLYEPKIMANVKIELEADVSNQLLIPRLEEMGWKKDEDFFAEVEFAAGRGTTGHEMNKRPDFILHKTGDGRKIGAKVVIEVKKDMKTTKEIDEAYEQGLSYAKYGGAEVLVICDKRQLRVYERNKKGKFEADASKCKRFSWEELQELENFNELKRLLS